MPRAQVLSPTRSDIVHADIRADILSNRLAPGTKLRFAELGDRYSVSTGVLREVLPRLVEQGLATSEPQLGFRVIDVSVERLTQLTEARVAIEDLVVRAAVECGDIAWESEVVATHHALARAGDISAPNGISEEWLAAHEAFHVAILEGCGNQYLVDSAVRLRGIFEVYRCWSRPSQSGRERDVASEHRAIMEAVVDRDVDRAAHLTEQHIRLTTELLLASPLATA